MLEAFNTAQQVAIRHTEGPLLVISGAGTGKTHLLTGKMLYLIKQKNIPPEQILALTFTEKATEEMLTRVESELPLSTEPPIIKTFHAFCEVVLRERGHEIGLPLDFKVLGGPDLWMFMKQNVVHLPLMQYRPLADPTRFLRSLLDYFSRFQDEDITPGQYAEFCRRKNISAASEEEKEYVTRHHELANIYEIYQKLLVKNGYLDFGGLITQALRLFEKRKSVLAEYQKHFAHILVDEFQDTNHAQNKLIMLFSKHHGNLTVVGDDDQSIYKWRGASLTNIASFKKNFPQAKTLVLNENFRSWQPILNLAYAIIQNNNPNRLEVQEKVNKKLVAHQTQNSGGIPHIHHFSELSEELEFIITQALKNQKKGHNTAILVRTNSLALPFLEFLEKEAIPHQHFAPSFLFQKPIVKDCLALLRVLGNPKDDLALFRFLSLARWDIPMKTLLSSLQHAREKSIPLFDSLQGSAYTEIQPLLAKLLEYSRSHKVSEVLGKFLFDTGYLKSLRSQAASAVHLASFSENIKAFESNSSERNVLDFLAYMKLIEEGGEGRPENLPLDPSALKILTIHAAKGLEFDAVFIPGMVKGKFPTIRRRDPFEIPEELIPESLPEGDHHMEEERRLFYVGLTRAKRELTLTYSDFYDGKKEWKPSPFIAEALESGKAIMVEPPAHRGIRVKPGKSQTSFDFERKKKVQNLTLNLHKLSFSQLSTFQTCPLKYQFRYLFRIPAPLPSQVHFGTSIHNTLRDFYSRLQKHPDDRKKNLLPFLLECFEKRWVSVGYDSRELAEDQKEAGRKMLKRYYEKEKPQLVIPKFLEKSFELRLPGITFTGRIDRIDELSDGTFEIIDYKTGAAKNENLKNNLQLSLYALASRDALGIVASKLSLYFLDGLEKVSTTRSNNELEKCREEIIECAKELAASDFAATPGFHCRYCDFKFVCPSVAVNV